MSGLDEALPGIRRAKKRRIIEPSDANEWAGCASRDARKKGDRAVLAARRRECRRIIACRPQAAWQAGLKSRIIARSRSVASSRRAHAQLSARQGPDRWSEDQRQHCLLYTSPSPRD